MKIKNFFTALPIAYKYLILICLFVFGGTVQRIEAVEPDGMLYSKQTEERAAAYKMKAQQLAEKIATAVDDKEKQNFLVQQQLLTKLEEFPDKPEKPSMDLRFSKLGAQNNLSWQEFDQYLERYISIIKEGKISARNLKNTNNQMQTLYNQLIALDEKSPDQNILQLQYAIQVRNSDHQSEIVNQLKQRLGIAKEQYPAVLERIHLEQHMVYEQKKILDQAKKNLQRLEDEKNRQQQATTF